MSGTTNLTAKSAPHIALQQLIKNLNLKVFIAQFMNDLT